MPPPQHCTSDWTQALHYDPILFVYFPHLKCYTLLAQQGADARVAISRERRGGAAESNATGEISHGDGGAHVLPLERVGAEV